MYKIDSDFSTVPEGYRLSVKRIIRVGLSNKIVLTPLEAFNIWSNFSESSAAGWLNIIDDDEILQAIEIWYKKETEREENRELP